MGNSLARDKTDYSGDIDLRHFELLRCVGKGAFGKVRIVEKKDTNKLYALKYINKLQCIKMRAVPNIFRERAILEEIDHPFVVNLRFAFQDDENMFMVLDLMNGGDMRYHLDRLGGFPQAVVRFIAMELICALSYLHKKQVVHRDLKPDNVLFDQYGHVSLTDFNIAVHYNLKRLTSQSGTLSYMAPEVFTKVGYSWPIDWWSLGVLLYEALFGKRPFRGHTDEELKDNIMHQELHIPICNLVTNKPVPLDPEGENFLRRLLERDVRKRIGCGTMGVEEIEAHPWFNNIDWDAVPKRKYEPMFVPDPDAANFDPTFDLEELLLDDNPLNYRPRKKKTTKPEPQSNSAPMHTQRSQPVSQIGGSPNSGAPTEQKRKLTPKERLQLDLDYIDAHFKLFDSTVFERYDGFVDPKTMTVSDEVPSWVRDVSQIQLEDRASKNHETFLQNLPPSLLGSPTATPPSRSRMASQEWKPPPPPAAERFRNNSSHGSRGGGGSSQKLPSPLGSPHSSRSSRRQNTSQPHSHSHAPLQTSPRDQWPSGQMSPDGRSGGGSNAGFPIMTKSQSQTGASSSSSYSHKSRSMNNLHDQHSRTGSSNGDRRQQRPPPTQSRDGSANGGGSRQPSQTPASREHSGRRP
ncbi:hypothetical protein HDU86_006667 [Geranomyces michiganensis]|nr:hypothetical protein HDU86_006667 [Geranomyces michiganensis]